MIHLLTKLLMKWCIWRGRVFNITGTGGPDDIYLIRYYVIQSQYFNFFIHQFLRSDRDDLHDHPWNFMTYLVKGAYEERKWNEKTKKVESMFRFNVDDLFGLPRQQNRLVFRKATDQHQVVVFEELKAAQKDQATLTLCFTGPIKREWGFIKDWGSDEYGPNREWVPWKKYLGLPEDTPGRG